MYVMLLCHCLQQQVTSLSDQFIYFHCPEIGAVSSEIVSLSVGSLQAVPFLVNYSGKI